MIAEKQRERKCQFTYKSLIRMLKNDDTLATFYIRELEETRHCGTLQEERRYIRAALGEDTHRSIRLFLTTKQDSEKAEKVMTLSEKDNHRKALVSKLNWFNWAGYWFEEKLPILAIIGLFGTIHLISRKSSKNTGGIYKWVKEQVNRDRSNDC